MGVIGIGHRCRGMGYRQKHDGKGAEGSKQAMSGHERRDLGWMWSGCEFAILTVKQLEGFLGKVKRRHGHKATIKQPIAVNALQSLDSRRNYFLEKLVVRNAERKSYGREEFTGYRDIVSNYVGLGDSIAGRPV